MFSSKRSKYILVSSLLSVVLALIVYLIFSKPYSADVLWDPEPESSYCDPLIEDCTVDLIVVDVNLDENYSGSGRPHEIIAYAKSGRVVASAPASLGGNTLAAIDNESEFNSEATPLGVYHAGSVWSNSENDPDGFPYHPNIGGSIAGAIGPLFIDLSGIPVEGGDPLGGLSDPNARHIGIHSGVDLNKATAGCIRTDENTVRTIANNLSGGTPVIITDQLLAGYVNPVDAQTYANKPFVDFSPSVEVTGARVGKIHQYGNYWISETAKPTGPYTVVGSASGYFTNKNRKTFSRKTGPTGLEGIVDPTQTTGGTNVTLGLPSDGMKSNYFNSFYIDGYTANRELRASQWDTIYSNRVFSGSKPETGSYQVELEVRSQGPQCFQAEDSEDPEALLMLGECRKVSKFAVHAVTTPWHDLPKSTGSKEPGFGKLLAEFEYDYSVPAEKITVDLDVAGMDDVALSNLYNWGVAIVQVAKINHVFNDYIALEDKSGEQAEPFGTSGNDEIVAEQECGNDICNSGEDHYSCPADCASSGDDQGDNLADVSPGPEPIAGEMFVCGDGFCDDPMGESSVNCPNDCLGYFDDPMIAELSEEPQPPSEDYWYDPIIEPFIDAWDWMTDWFVDDTPLEPEPIAGEMFVCGDGFCDDPMGESFTACPNDCDDPAIMETYEEQYWYDPFIDAWDWTIGWF